MDHSLFMDPSFIHLFTVLHAFGCFHFLFGMFDAFVATHSTLLLSMSSVWYSDIDLGYQYPEPIHHPAASQTKSKS
jgi:hypothetical protein